MSDTVAVLRIKLDAVLGQPVFCTDLNNGLPALLPDCLDCKGRPSSQGGLQADDPRAVGAVRRSGVDKSCVDMHEDCAILISETYGDGGE